MFARCFDSRSGRTKSPRRVSAKDFTPSRSSLVMLFKPISFRISVKIQGKGAFRASMFITITKLFP